MPQFVQADLNPLWLRVLSHRHPSSNRNPRRHSSEGLTVSRFDAHPNERAYELAAEAIRGRLLDNFTRTKE